MTFHSLIPSAIRPTRPFWLARHRNGFLDSLALQGYAPRTIKTYRRMTDRLCAEAEARGLGPDTLDTGVIGELAKACPSTGTAYMERELAMATRRFTDYLIQAGMATVVKPPLPPSGSAEQLCAELDRWLRRHRGMYGNRLRTHCTVLRRLMAFCCTATGTADDLACITPEILFVFLDGGAGKGGWRLPYVRNILRF